MKSTIGSSRLTNAGILLMVFIIQFVLISNIKSINESFQRSFINTAFYLIIYLCCIHINKDFNKKGWSKTVVLKYISLILTVGFARSFIEIFILQNSIFNISFSNSTLSIKAGNTFFYIILALICSTLLSLFIQYQEKRKIEKENLELNTSIMESQIQILNNQLSPHFLFNGINDLYSASILDKEKTPEMILKLGEILKFVTYQLKKKEIYLVEEIEQIHLQLEYFELRNNIKIPLNLKIAEEISNIRVAPFLLIPLVENAIKHGNFNDLQSKTYLNIEIAAKENELTICVENSFQKIDHKDLFKMNGIGSENYKKRLDLLYVGKHELTITQEENKFTSFLKLKLNN
jgi:sensor histidine kinase YesM